MNQRGDLRPSVGACKGKRDTGLVSQADTDEGTPGNHHICRNLTHGGGEERDRERGGAGLVPSRRGVWRAPAEEQGPALKGNTRNLPKPVAVRRGLGHSDPRRHPRRAAWGSSVLRMASSSGAVDHHGSRGRRPERPLLLDARMETPHVCEGHVRVRSTHSNEGRSEAIQGISVMAHGLRQFLYMNSRLERWERPVPQQERCGRVRASGTVGRLGGHWNAATVAGAALRAPRRARLAPDVVD